MRSDRWSHCFGLWVAGVIFCFTACSSPATPPAPPAELPAALIFPQDLTIDVQSILSDTSGSSALRLVGANGQFSNNISQGAELAQSIGGVADDILGNLASLEIPISASTMTYQTSMNSNMGPQGSTIMQHFKIDLAPFDYDNDGVNESCSGNSASTPICFRIWYASTVVGGTPSQGNFSPIMAGVFATYPTTSNPGAGQFKLHISDSFGADPSSSSGDEFFMEMIYDQRDPENKMLEAFGSGNTSLVSSTQDSGQPGSNQCTNITSGHVRVTQVGPDATAIKTIAETSHFTNTDNCPTTDEQYLGQFKEGSDFWIGSVVAEAAEVQNEANFSDVCAQISTGNQTSSTNCSGIGISVDDLDFISTATSNDYNLPNDFPVTPTF